LRRHQDTTNHICNFGEDGILNIRAGFASLIHTAKLWMRHINTSEISRFWVGVNATVYSGFFFLRLLVYTLAFIFNRVFGHSANHLSLQGAVQPDYNHLVVSLMSVVTSRKSSYSYLAWRTHIVCCAEFEGRVWSSGAWYQPHTGGIEYQTRSSLGISTCGCEVES